MAKAKIGDTIRIVCLADDTYTGKPDPSSDEYRGKTGTVKFIDVTGALHGTWGGLAILPEDMYTSSLDEQAKESDYT
ncbi:hypothetical protein N7T98_25595 [Pseudomonas syringae pv. tomato]|uniref:hypothetical protein n=1 Tax=Pseudomonas syringae group genomosp. 3 TaxID=251701 RepID=UPI0022A78AD5|nr:hypothetical protein [Pseudomonas syringae group genomosp. 3]MCZ0950755.1 hypothetical protein [Pseudomonas syringae pv. tomato]